MQTRDLLADYIENHDLCPGASSLEDWLAKDWLEFRVGQRLVPVIPLSWIRGTLAAHDLHHALTGYPTTLRGECELAAWELTSGGCGWNPIFWLDRSSAVAIGLILYPTAILSALRRGRGSRNLYGTSTNEILEIDVEVLRDRMKL